MSDEPPKKKLRLEGNSVMCFTCLSDELVERIFKYLGFDDQMMLMEVCKRFFDVLQLPVFAKKVVLALEHCVLSHLCPPFNFLVNSNRKFFNLRFGDGVRVGYGRKLWNKIGRNVEHVIFNSTKPYFEFDLILWEFPKVKDISIRFRHLMKFDIPETIKNVHCFSIYRFVSQKDFEDFTRLLNRLETFTVKRINWSANLGDKTLFDIENLKVIKGSLIGRCTSKFVNVVPFNYLKKKAIIPADIQKISFWDLYPLDGLVNLQTIRLTLAKNGCFFVHSAQNLPKLAQVIIYCKEDNHLGYCKICFNNLKNSSGNINSLEIVGKKFPRLPFLVENLTSKPLKKLSLELDCNYNEISLNHPDLEELRLVVGIVDYTFNAADLPESSKINKLMVEAGKFNAEANIRISDLQMLIRKCPAMKIVKFPSLTIEEILMIEQGWPNLIELLVDSVKFEEKILVERLQGKFKKLKVLGNTNKQVNSESQDFSISRQEGEIFKKIPTLRQSSRMGFRTFCMLEYGIPQVSSKLIDYDD